MSTTQVEPNVIAASNLRNPCISQPRVCSDDSVLQVCGFYVQVSPEDDDVAITSRHVYKLTQLERLRHSVRPKLIVFFAVASV